MNPDIISVVIDKLRKLSPEKASDLTVKNAQFITLQSLDLDSLDTLQLAMDIEDALGMNIEIVNFPATLTIGQLSEHLAEMRAELREPA
ncbi:acyl carrier protein [Hyphomicrobium facile]|uniref:Phosphopantetheine attachment site n=1 Tax=Hyphomicrobium facile TaxID=51670 RepID=A0A1I7N5W4_9HYPH|nr:acyl carrier protein [Hyphomicrobium facile]SFV30045.1 Phosphopantetheine attachment site [Hyphomicrobium facile]